MHRRRRLHIAAICCFTPVLVILFSGLGLSWMAAYLDYVLLPALALFLVNGLRGWRISRARAAGHGESY